MALWPFSRKPATPPDSPYNAPPGSGVDDPPAAASAAGVSGAQGDGVRPEDDRRPHASLGLIVDRAGLARFFRDHLAEEGYRPVINEYGDVQFKSEGLIHVIELFDNDLGYARLLLPAILSVPEGREDEFRLIALAVTDVMKGVKCSFGSSMSLVVESFFATPHQFCDTLPRSLSALRSALSELDRMVGC